MTTERLNSTISKAQQGNPKAISELLNAALMPQGTIARVTSLNNCLTIFANGRALPDRESLIGVIERGFADLEVADIARVKVYGKSSANLEDGWSDEIVFFDEAISAAKTSRGLNGKALKQKGAGLLVAMGAGLRKLLANKKVVYGFIGLTVAGLAASGGLAGLRIVQARSAHAATLSAAQALVSEAAANEDDGTEQMEAQLIQLKKARQLLRGIPESKASSYQMAQQELALVSQKIDSAEVALSDVQSATGKLNDINGAVAAALAKVDRPPYAIENWNMAKRELVSGITKLQSIPQYGPMAEKVQSQIEAYQGKVAWIDQAIINEKAGVDELAKAKGLARDAYNATNGKRKFAVSDLEKARDKWQTAIDRVKKVPPTTNAYRSVVDEVDTYTKNKNSVIDGIYEINNCSYRDSKFESMRDMCYSVYLSLTKPD